MKKKTNNPQYQKRQQKRIKQKILRRKNKTPNFKGKNIIFHIAKTIRHFFPDLRERIEELDDPRLKRCDYSLYEIVTAAIMMFILKEGSRNAMNKDRLEGHFQENYFKLTGGKQPHMDTVDAVFRKLKEEEIIKLKNALIHALIENKVLDKGRFMGVDFIIVYDGTGVHNYNKRHCDSCLTTTTKIAIIFFDEALTQLQSEGLKQDIIDCLKKFKEKKFKTEKEWKESFEKKLGRTLSDQEHGLILKQASIKPGITTYYHKVLEAKLICSNGFAISLGSEWIENDRDDYVKQDCEQIAFKRLSKEIKRIFPRLNMCVVVDGLYPNAPFFDICDTHKWRFICTFKDGNLPSLQEKITEFISNGSENTLPENIQIGDNKIERVYRWINDLNYSGFKMSWVECVESVIDSNNKTETKRFVYLVSEKIDNSTVVNYVKAGRLRQKIENEGFNTQKNGGYNMEHKYSRVNLQATKNYYQCLQIGHMINQLCVLSQTVKKQLREWESTLKHCWKVMVGFLSQAAIDAEELVIFVQKKTQYRYDFLL